MVPLLQLVKVCEQGGTWQSPVGRDDRVGALPAYGEGTPFQMARPDLQHILIGGVVDGQLHIDLRDLHDPHDLVIVDV